MFHRINVVPTCEQFLLCQVYQQVQSSISEVHREKSPTPEQPPPVQIQPHPTVVPIVRAPKALKPPINVAHDVETTEETTTKEYHEIVRTQSPPRVQQPKVPIKKPQPSYQPAVLTRAPQPAPDTSARRVTTTETQMAFSISMAKSPTPEQPVMAQQMPVYKPVPIIEERAKQPTPQNAEDETQVFEECFVTESVEIVRTGPKTPPPQREPLRQPRTGTAAPAKLIRKLEQPRQIAAEKTTAESTFARTTESQYRRPPTPEPPVHSQVQPAPQRVPIEEQIASPVPLVAQEAGMDVTEETTIAEFHEVVELPGYKKEQPSLPRRKPPPDTAAPATLVKSPAQQPPAEMQQTRMETTVARQVQLDYQRPPPEHKAVEHIEPPAPRIDIVKVDAPKRQVDESGAEVQVIEEEYVREHQEIIDERPPQEHPPLVVRKPAEKTHAYIQQAPVETQVRFVV